MYNFCPDIFVIFSENQTMIDVKFREKNVDIELEINNCIVFEVILLV